MLALAKAFRKSTQGSNLIQFAIVAPIFLMLIIGVIDVGAMMVVQNSLDAGARAASRFGLTGATAGTTRQGAIINEINTTVTAYSGGLVNLANLVVDVTSYPDLTNLKNNTGTSGSYGVGGQVVKYTLSYDWHSFLATFGFPSTITLKGIAVVQNENF